MIIARVLAAAAAVAGLAAWIVFLRAGLVLSHYDAKAHLVVARRIVDSLTPGWQQIGAVWLPLPHLINLLPVQIDLFYRTGAFASLFSLACFAATVYAAARLVLAITASRLGAVVAAALLVLNPNLLYLQATPMTEPLLIAVMALAVLWLYEWVPLNQDVVPWRLRLVLFAAMWTRYEAWPIVCAAIGAATYAASARGTSPGIALQRGARLAVWPAAAVVLFLINSRLSIGEWLVTGGFYVPDPLYQGRLFTSLIAVWWGTHQLGTRLTELAAVGAAIYMAVQALRSHERSHWLIPICLFAAAALPVYAFYQGHPFRIRYMVPLAAFCALFGGIAVGLARTHAARTLAGVLVGLTLIHSPPWRDDAPMLVEAQWDVPKAAERRTVTACLAPAYRGEKVLASMGSLAHYMQELSHEGFVIADFIHEGNGMFWLRALESGPAEYAGWMLVEEQAEGGDVLARRILSDPEFARGMERVCEGGGVALYRRQ